MKNYILSFICISVFSSCFLMNKYKILGSYKIVLQETSLLTKYTLDNTLDKLQKNNALINSLEGTWMNEKFMEEIERTGSIYQSMNIKEPIYFFMKKNDKLIEDTSININGTPTNSPIRRSYSLNIKTLESSSGSLIPTYRNKEIKNSEIKFISKNKIWLKEEFNGEIRSYIFNKYSEKPILSHLDFLLSKIFEYKIFKIKNTPYKNISFNDDKSITGWDKFDKYDLEKYPYYYIRPEYELIILTKGDKSKSFAVIQDGNTWYWYDLITKPSFSRMPQYEKGKLAYTMTYKENGLLGMVQE